MYLLYTTRQLRALWLGCPNSDGQSLGHQKELMEKTSGQFAFDFPNGQLFHIVDLKPRDFKT